MRLDYDPGIARKYAPLRDHPDLFLKFARLAEKRDIAVDDMLEWAGRYGLLGAEEGIDHVALEPTGGISLASSGQGRRESLAHFSGAVVRAARCLRLYEAAMAPDEMGIETLRRMYKSRPDALKKALEEDERKKLKKEALEEVEREVQGYIESECYPLLYRRRDGGYVHSWGFRSLLGAMYLQMMWVMEAGDRITLCKFPDCFKIIDYEKPDSRQAELNPKTGEPYKRGPYKTRKDKEFCGKNCTVKWYYHYGGGKEKARERYRSKR
jgi:hypothetical protein